MKILNLKLKKMDKITKVQEVSSFIMNFDNKYWNEVILRLTIIGIRYVTNNYNNAFSWKLKDLNKIMEQLNKTKENKGKNINNKKDSKKEYNYNYSNSTFFKKKENNNSLNGKPKYYINNSIKNEINEINNKSALLLSERNGIENSKINKKTKKSKGENIYLKNKNIRNKMLSLKQKSFNENKKNMNVIVSNFPFHPQINEKENYKDKIEKNKNNLIFYFNQEKNDYLYKMRNYGKNNINNDNFIYEKLNNSYEEYVPGFSDEGYNFKNNNKYLKEVNLKKNDYKNSSKEFISELRKMSQKKEYKYKNYKKLSTNIIYHSQPKLSGSYTSPLIENKKFQNKSYNKNNLGYNIKEKKPEISIINKDNVKDNFENISSKTINKKYNFNSTNDNLQINFQYGIKDNNNNNKNLEILPVRLNINKYLKDPNHKSEKINISFTKDSTKKNKTELNFDYNFKKESDKNPIIDIHYKTPNTDRHSCKNLYEIQQPAYKKNNTESINKYNIDVENKNEENNNLK